MPLPQVAAVVLTGVTLAVLTGVLVLSLRTPGALIARHAANLSLPFGLVFLLAALAIAGPGEGWGTALLILLLQVVSGATESHMAGRVQWLEERRAEKGA